MRGQEAGIYKRKQESKKKKHAFNQESDKNKEKRKHSLDQENDF